MTWGFAASFWASEGSHRYECLLSSPVPFWQVPQSSQSTAQLWEKNTEAVVFIKNIHETPCKEKWSIATPLGCQHVVEKCAIAADFSGHAHFFRQESLLQLHWRDIRFFIREFQCDLFFHARLRWLGPCKPFRTDFSLEQVAIFSNISGDITTLWVYGSTSFDINRADGMLASNAKCISRDSVTCFGSNKCPWSRGHLSWCFKCSSLLACKGSNWAAVFFGCTSPCTLDPCLGKCLPHAYAEWRGPMREFPRLGAYPGASAEFFVGWSCTW